MINIGNNPIKNIFAGNTQVDKVYLGTDVVWEHGDYSNTCLTFEFTEDGTFYWKTTNSTWIKTIQYRKNGGEWTSITSSTDGTVCSVLNGDIIEVKGTDTYYSDGNTKCCSFGTSNNAYIYGNVNSLINFDEEFLNNNKSVYNKLFCDCSYIDIHPSKKLLLPTSMLSYRCYYKMFQGCTRLTKAPDMSNVVDASAGCGYMFDQCTNLVTPPDLSSVTSVGSNGFEYMFQGCSRLTRSPELPATNIAANCYLYMFSGCSSITLAPLLLATTLYDDCYLFMFYNCTSLTTVQSSLPATTLAYECYRGMFQGCTHLTTTPELPATTLAGGCYRAMLANTAISKIVLPATTLQSRCYYYMCESCTNLKYVKMLATDVSASDAMKGWMENVPKCGLFIKNPDAAWTTFGNHGVLIGWIIEYEDPQHINLPAGYTQLGCIASDSSNPYIDLNIKLYEVLNTQYDIAIKFTMPNSTSYNQMRMFSCVNYDSYAGTEILCDASLSNNKRIIAGKYIGGTGTGNKLGRGDDLQVDLPVKTPPDKNVYNLYNLGLTHNWGTSLFCLFTSEDKTTTSNYSIITLRYFKLFIEGVLVRDMVPCRNPNNVVGLYDTVNDVFYSSPNGAAFIAGPEI